MFRLPLLGEREVLDGDHGEIGAAELDDAQVLGAQLRVAGDDLRHGAALALVLANGDRDARTACDLSRRSALAGLLGRCGLSGLEIGRLGRESLGLGDRLDRRTLLVETTGLGRSLRRGLGRSLGRRLGRSRLGGGLGSGLGSRLSLSRRLSRRLSLSSRLSSGLGRGLLSRLLRSRLRNRLSRRRLAIVRVRVRGGGRVGLGVGSRFRIGCSVRGRARCRDRVR